MASNPSLPADIMTLPFLSVTKKPSSSVCSFTVSLKWLVTSEASRPFSSYCMHIKPFSSVIANFVSFRSLTSLICSLIIDSASSALSFSSSTTVSLKCSVTNAASRPFSSYCMPTLPSSSVTANPSSLVILVIEAISSISALAIFIYSSNLSISLTTPLLSTRLWLPAVGTLSTPCQLLTLVKSALTIEELI